MKLNHILAESSEIPARLSKLISMIEQVAADFKTKLVVDSIESPSNMVNAGTIDCVVKDETGILMWLGLIYGIDGKLEYYNILAEPTEGDQWDFVDMGLTYSYDNFLGDVADVEVEAPRKDYGIDILNIIAWVIYAHQQLSKNPVDLNGLFDAGFYKVRLTLTDSKLGSATIGYWVQATSSSDAIEQIKDMVGSKLKDHPTVIQFSKEPPIE